MQVQSLKGKVAIVTGSSSGIGKEIAKALAGKGAHVVVTSRSHERAARVAEQIVAQGGKALACCFDLDDRHGGRLLLDTVIEQFSGIDILVNNALSRSAVSPCPVSEIQYDKLAAGITSNLTHTLALTSLAYPYLKLRRGGVINIGSAVINRHMDGLFLYAVIKGAFAQMSKSLAAEWAGDGIRVNLINPGFVETDSMEERYSQATLREYKRRLQDRHPLGRTGKTGDVAECVVFLASEKASWMTGAVIDLDGGYSLQGVPFPMASGG